MKRSQTRCLSAEFYSRDTQQVAISLLGMRLVRLTEDEVRLSGIIVEVEAYLPAGDLASHSYRGPSKKNASMFSQAGTLYVYPIHARHCLNIVTEEQGRGAAVLIRAIEPDEGLERMQVSRGLNQNLKDADLRQIRNAIRLTAGPAKLCEALEIDRSHDGENLLLSSRVWLENNDDPSMTSRRILTSKRIGISKSQALPLRWFFDGNRFVSGCAREHTQGRTWTFR